MNYGEYSCCPKGYIKPNLERGDFDMKTISKKLLSLVLAVLMLVAAVPFSVLSVTAQVPSEYEGYTETVGATAVSGENLGVTWAIYTKGTDVKLVISGEGPVTKTNEHSEIKSETTGWGNNKEGTYKNLAPWKDYATTITSIDVGYGITSIGQNAFYKMTALKDISLPESLEFIDYNCFSTCTALERITLPSGIQRMHQNIFKGCTNLKYVVFTSKNCNVFQSSKTNDYDYYNDTTSMFDGCKNLKCVFFPKYDTPTSSATYNNVAAMFYNCKSGSVTIIGDSESYAKTYVEEVLPSYIESYSDNSSSDAKQKSYYGLKVSYKGFDDVVSGGFVYDSSNADSTVNNSIMYVKSRNSDVPTYTLNIVGSGAMSKSLSTNRTKPYMSDVSTPADPSDTEITKIIVDSAITELGTCAFYGMKALTDFQWTPTATEPKILAQAFRNCTALTEITLPNGLKSLYPSLFQGCSSLKTVNIPSTVTTVGKGVFESTEIEFLVLPKAVDTINENAFKNAKSLKAIFVQGSAVTTWGKDPFLNTTSGLTVYTDSATGIPTAEGVRISEVKGLDVTADVQDIMTKCLLSVEAFAYYEGGEKTGIRALITADETIRDLLEETLGQTVEYGFIAGNASFADGEFTLGAQKTVSSAVYENKTAAITYTGDSGAISLEGKHAFCAVLYNINEANEYVLTGYVKIGESVTEATNNTSFSVGSSAFAGASVSELKNQ